MNAPKNDNYTYSILIFLFIFIPKKLFILFIEYKSNVICDYIYNIHITPIINDFKKKKENIFSFFCLGKVY